MPAQHTIFGRPVRLQMPPRRFQLLGAIVVFLIVTLTLFGPPSSVDIPTVEEVKDTIKNPHLPKLPSLPSVHSPFGPSAHKPPIQPNSTTSSSYGVVEWFSDFKWRNPFSSSVTLDENRALLPPRKERPPIYTYYEPRHKQDKAVEEAEQRLLLAWRRAWWAQGFRPQVLSLAEAIKNPYYGRVQRMQLDAKAETEIMRWLAWGFMKGGILVDWLAFPMAPYDDPLLTFMRRKEYPKLTRIQPLNNAVFFGEDAQVEKVIKKALDNPLFKDPNANKDKIAELGSNEGGAMIGLLTEEDMDVDSKADGVAYYSSEAISSTYKTVSEKLTNTTQAKGLNELATLINSHLHLTFQSTFTDGLAVVKPLPEHTTALMYEAIDIARNLTQCPASPIPDSCPPNRPKCKPCNPSHTQSLQLMTSFQNTSTLYSIGVIPHPYTLCLLHYTRDAIDGNFLRRETQRDQWVLAATKDLLGDDASGEHRVLHLKEMIASPYLRSNSLWLTAERESQHDLDWIFGFQLPRIAADSAPSSSVSPGPQPRPDMPEPLKGVEVPEERWIVNEETRLHKAREAIKSTDKNMRPIVDMVEKWNLYDTEAWRFARAWSARRRVEREKWEEEETKFAGTERKAGVQSGDGGRWND
ncbi:hypothetical protein GQ43DRAFT_415261 [Delitschia confertaspora ATCC 74209]|uniref:Uncharacterized protein n=1 Tax=Delitschia confertaspora ATCC 74209 TaxID=1513339 RepID=A0A9P4JNY1_9PLEO|nr:hypothetical protein GQ43DRAFT_415261 [Delitschia confertaspora ATCC 74209]